MKAPDFRWRIRQAIINSAGFLHAFPRRGAAKRLLFISESNPIAQAQLFPFFFHYKDFLNGWGIEIRELPLSRFLDGRHPYQDSVDAVCLQSWFDLTPLALLGLVQKVKSIWPDAALAYFDWFAPVDLRYADTLNEYIDVYVKKQVLRDFSQYGCQTLGDTNLVDYYARRFGLTYPEVQFSVPTDFREKLFLGTHFAFSDYMVPNFLGTFPGNGARFLDLHARITVKGSEWYSRMRQEALDRALGLEERFKVACRGGVPRKQYFSELYSTKLCFSPFGYGEVCWRDFEAMFSGAMLLKPDMSHIDCFPDAFRPYETYVPLAWDLSDFDEKVEYYLRHEKEREQISRNAFELMHNYCGSRRFPYDMQFLLTRLGFEPR